MKRFVIAAALIAALGTSAVGQPPLPPLPAQQPPRPLPPAGVLTIPLPPEPETWYPPAGLVPGPVPPPPTYSGPPGPAIPYQKMGGLIVGTTGYYPFDTGAWQLGGTDGLTRQSGPFTMVYPPAPDAPAAAPCARTPLFRRLSSCR